MIDRFPLLAAVALGCADVPPEAPVEVDLTGIPVSASADEKADGEIPLSGIGCGGAVESRLGRRAPYQLFEFEGAQGQVVDFMARRGGGRSNLVMGLFALHPELEGQAIATNGGCEGEAGDACLQQVVLPLDAVYRLVVTTEGRRRRAQFSLEMQCEQLEGAGQPIVGDGCRPDLFFVEAAQGRAPAADFGAGYADALDALGLMGISVEPVLPERAGFDGHRRFFRVAFPAPVPEAGLCGVVSTLRAQAMALAPNVSWRVGRECAVRPLGVETFADDEMLEWHLDRVGVEPQRRGRPVDVAIIDTGLDDVMSRELGVSETDVMGGGAERHGHGAAMALYVRQIAPAARLHAVRVMDEGGVGDIADLARGIDSVLFDTHPARRRAAPLVVNISAGWPPELGKRRTLTGAGGCATLEDEVGAPVRYTLEVARALERPGRPISVVAAAGNRPGRSSVNDPLYAERFATTGEGYRRCDGAEAAWFFPAEYQHACRPLALGVGAIDARDRPSVISIDGAEPALVGPGELVYAARAGAPIRPADVCSEAPIVSRPARYVLTGTSVPTALTSAAVARIQSLAPLPSGWTSRLLRETGVRLGRSGPGGDVRRLDVGRALEAMGCRGLLRCTARDRDCRRAARRCALDPGAGAGLESAWPVDYEAADRCSAASEVGAWSDRDDCGPTGCAYEALPDRHSSGYVGPSPDWPGCPDCALAASGGGVYKLVAQPYPGLGGSTTLTDVTLVVSDGSSVVYKPLSGTWKPGVTRVVTLSLPGHLIASKLSAKFVATVLQPGKSAVRDVSGLRVF